MQRCLCLAYAPVINASRRLSTGLYGNSLAFRSHHFGAAAALGRRGLTSAPVYPRISGDLITSHAYGQEKRQRRCGRRALETCSIAPSASAAATTRKEIKDRLMLVDAQALLYKYAHAYGPDLLKSRKTGEDTSIAFGFLRTLLALLEFDPTHVTVVFDAPGKNFRHELYPAYKGDRPPQPPAIKLAMPRLRELLDAMQIPVLVVPGVEADDVIAMLAIRGVREGFGVAIASPDKDFFQLLQPDLQLLRPVRKKADYERALSSEFVAFNADTFRAEKGIEPSQWADCLAICGDSADNIPGIPGIGEKGAISLLQQFGTLDNILANASQLKEGKRKKMLMSEEGIAAARLGRELVTVMTEPKIPAVRIPMSEIALKIPTPEQQELALKIMADMEFNQHSAQLRAIWGRQAAAKGRPSAA